MKNRDGFTLIELIVGIAIMLIIFGGIVNIFGASGKSVQAGMNQQEAYEEARVAMEELKTSLRYATPVDPNGNVSTDIPVETSTTWTYTGQQFNKHWNIPEGTNEAYTITVELKPGDSWQDNSKRQIVITDSRHPDKQIKYPKYEKNSALTVNSFPITVDTDAFNTGETLYKITLPVKYNITEGEKVDTLESRVKPIMGSHYDETQTVSGSYNDLAADVTKQQANILIKTVVAMEKKGTLAKNAKGEHVSQIASGAMYQSTSNQAGTSVKVKNQLISDRNLSVINQKSWVLIPTLTNNTKTITAWALYIAKNVVNDVDGAARIANLTDSNYYKTQAEQNEIYYIRPKFGMLVYKFIADADGNITQPDGVFGYATGVADSTDPNSIIIDVRTWVDGSSKTTTDLISDTAFQNVKYYASSGSSTIGYIDDLYSGTTRTQTGTYCRIDYNEIGREYVKAICDFKGSVYEYYPDAITFNVNK